MTDSLTHAKTAPSKSARTRARIAEAAQSQFSVAGFNATSVRDIAHAAGCDPALIIRYFGSKEALFAEVGAFNLNLPDLSGKTPEAAARQLAAHFIKIWEDPKGGERFQILLRSAAAHEPSAERLRSIFAQQALTMISAYCADAPRAQKTAAMVASIILGTALTRHVLRLPHMVDMTPAALTTELATCLEPVLRAAGGTNA